MYLTEIIHDLDFTLDSKQKEVLHTLELKASKHKFSFPKRRSKISFHSNQGRNVKLLWDKNFFSKRNNYTLAIENVIEFNWKQNSQTITYRYHEHATDKLVHYWILHTFLPLYYTLENIYQMLHVGAVEIHGKACLFAAPSFGGKSTLTHFFLQKGHQLLSDDKLGFFKRDHEYCAVPSYPYVRDYRNLEDLGKYTNHFSKRALRVGCIYNLLKVGSEEQIKITRVQGTDKFSIIEMSSDIKLSMLKQKNFSTLNDLAKQLSIYEVTVPQAKGRLEEVYREIIKHFKQYTLGHQI